MQKEDRDNVFEEARAQAKVMFETFEEKCKKKKVRTIITKNRFLINFAYLKLKI